MNIRDKIGDIIYELADNRGKIESNITALSRPIVVHLIKIYLWRDTTYKNHWIREVFGFLNDVPKLKRSNKYPKQKDLYKWLWTESRESNFNKTLRSVISLTTSDGDYKNLKKPDKVSSIDVKDFVEKYMNWISYELSDTGEIEFDDVQDKINSLLKNFPYRLESE